MVKICIKLDKQTYQTLEQIQQNLQTLTTYFENIEIEIDEEETNNPNPPKQVTKHIP
jgi:hypothetical protein